MADCSLTELKNRSKVYSQEMAVKELLGAILYLVCTQLMPMACSLTDLKGFSKIYSQRMNDKELMGALLWLICQLAGGGGGGGGGITIGIFYPNTVAEMKAIATAATNKRAFLCGFLKPGDGFGSTYYWDATNINADTDGFGNQLLNVIRPNDNPVPAPGLWVQYTA